jgi:DNA-binding MarR family transcriptional regulator
MALSNEDGNTIMRLWLLLHRANDVLSLCEDSIYREYGLTAEQWRVLARLKYYGRPLNPTELALAMERSSNSVSMLVDRMVKAGLVKRTRDRKDRRVVWVSMTSKGENAVEPAIPEGWKLIQKVLSPLSSADRRALADMLETVKCEAFACLHPETDRSEIARRSSTNAPDIYTRMSRHLHRSGPSAQPDTGVTEQQRLCPDGT